jgi:hypothetical protein
VTEIVTENLIAIEERDAQLHRRGDHQFETSGIPVTREISPHVTWTSAVPAVTLETDHLQQGQRSRTLPFLALAHHIVVVVSGEGEEAGTLEDGEGPFTMMNETGIMTHETVYQTAHIGHVVDHLYGEIVIFETIENLIGEIETIVGFRGSTTLT